METQDQRSVHAGSDARYRIHAAKTEIREGYRLADADRILASYSDDFEDWSDGWPSFGDGEAKIVMRARLEALFQKHRVQLAPIIITIRLFGESALAYGWHEFEMTPHHEAQPSVKRTRFMELWSYEPDGHWRIARFLNNLDQPAAFAEAVVAELHAGTKEPF